MWSGLSLCWIILNRVPESVFLFTTFAKSLLLSTSLGVLTVESQDRNHSIQYLKHASCGLESSNINKKEITGVSKRHVPNRFWTESPSPFSCFPYSPPLLLTTILVFVSRVTRSTTQHTLLEFWDEVQSNLTHERYGQNSNKKHMHKDEAVPESRLGLKKFHL